MVTHVHKLVVWEGYDVYKEQVGYKYAYDWLEMYILKTFTCFHGIQIFKSLVEIVTEPTHSKLQKTLSNTKKKFTKKK